MATPRSISQPPTSFIASWHLGIHHTPLVAYLPRFLARTPAAHAAGETLETKVQAPALRDGPDRFIFEKKLVLSRPASRRFVNEQSSSDEIGFYPSYALFKERSEILPPRKISGADRVRTDDIQLAKLALSQLSYSPE